MVVGNITETQATFYPPTLLPPYMGVHPPTKVETSFYGGKTSEYFQNYRNETLSKFSIPPYEWRMQATQYSPKPDLVAATKRRMINRYLTMPSNDISTIDVERMREVDELYKIVQVHRSQYKDRTGTMHPLEYFMPNDYKYQCAPGMTTSYIRKYPQNYVEYKKPTILPLTYSRQNQMPSIPDLSLSGIYNKTSCIAYKR